MSAFNDWYNEIADMPKQDQNGNWFDLETGLTFDDYLKNQPRKARESMSANALKNRNKAKALGGLALKGSKKQKEWAEKIRADKLEYMSTEAGMLIVDRNGLCTHSKFWIENRAKTALEFQEFILEQKGLLKRYKKAQEAPKSKRDIMRRGWEIARQAVEKHGKGTAKEYFALSLKQAWSEFKNSEDIKKIANTYNDLTAKWCE